MTFRFSCNIWRFCFNRRSETGNIFQTENEKVKKYVNAELNNIVFPVIPSHTNFYITMPLLSKAIWLK